MKVFVEEQKFNQWWFWLALLALVGLVIGAVLVGNPELKNNLTELWTTIAIVSFTFILILLLVLLMKLETKIDEQGIHYGFWPFQMKPKLAPWNEIEECSVRQYSPLLDYGGWGYKIMSFRKKGHALNIKGNIGIQLVFKTERNFFLEPKKKARPGRS